MKMEDSSSVAEVHVLTPKLMQEAKTHKKKNRQNITKEKKPKKNPKSKRRRKGSWVASQEALDL